MTTENKNGNKKSMPLALFFLLNIADELFRSCIFIVYWSYYYCIWMYILLFIAFLRI